MMSRSVLRDFIAAAVIAVIIASVALLSSRRNALRLEQVELAQQSIELYKQGRALPADVLLAVVHSTTGQFQFAPVRTVVNDRNRELGRSLTLNTNPDDKLLYDVTSTTLQHGDMGRLLDDDSGRALATHRTSNGDVAIVLTPIGRLAAFPWLQLLGVVALGALVAAAAARTSNRLNCAMLVAASIAIIAMPLIGAAQPIAIVAILVLAVTTALAHGVGVTTRARQAVSNHRIAYRFVAPAAIAMLILVVVPFTIGIGLGFFDHAQGTWHFVGLKNFASILSGGGHPLIDPLNFWFVLGVTVLWTAVNVVLAVAIGVTLAMILSQRWMRGKKAYRMLLILPWAIPNYITALIWKGMFAGEYGAINSLLHACGLDRVSWFSSWATAFFANVATNTWLGFPFMMVVAIGALQSIPGDLYEAAAVDGASPWQRFIHITLPHLRPALGPAIALGSIWTFNMFSVIYLVSDGAPGGSTNILVTDAYRWAFERGGRYGMAAAYATLIFGLLMLWTYVRGRAGKRSTETAT
jgi:ABC-type sugar transport system permease subunit